MGQYDNLDDFMKSGEAFGDDFEKKTTTDFGDDFASGLGSGMETGSSYGSGNSGGLRMKEDPEPTSGSMGGGLRMKEEAPDPVENATMRYNAQRAAGGSINPGAQGGAYPGGPAGNYPGSGAGGPGGAYPNGGAAYGGGGYVSPKPSSSSTKIVVGAILIIAVIALIGVVLKIMKNKYVPGELNGSTYTNAYFGVQANMSSDWTVQGYTGSDEMAEIRKGTPVAELVASKQSMTNAASFNIMVIDGKIAMGTPDLEKLKSMYKQELEQQMQGTGLSMSDITSTKVTIAGKSCDAYEMKLTYTVGSQSIDMYAIQAYMIKGRYISAYTSIGLKEADAKKAFNELKAYSAGN